MKQIVDKLNKIAKKINENVELSDRDLIIDSLDSITKAYGGTPNDSTLIVDKLDDIYNNIGSGGGGGDLSTATVTLINNVAWPGPSIIATGAIAENDPEFPLSVINARCSTGATDAIQVIMFKGRAEIKVEADKSSTATITYTGSCEPGLGGTYIVTGDCTFTMAK